MRSRRGALLLACLLATAPAFARGVVAGKTPDACRLLKSAEIATIQEAKLVEAKASAGREGETAVAQCFFLTDPMARSISVRWVMPAAGGDADAARAHWQEVFHGEKGEEEAEEHARERAERREEEEEERPPLPVAGVGEEAFWTADAASGALYVLAGRTFLRISVGGVTDPALRQERTRQLARAALRRLPRSSPRPR
jgi:hypothetical protein